jgi:hypothetical protein
MGWEHSRGQPLAVHRLARAVALVFGAQLWAAPVIITPAGDLERATEPAAISRRASRYIPACDLGRIGRHSGDAGFWRAAARVRAGYTELRRRIKQFKIDRVRPKFHRSGKDVCPQPEVTVVIGKIAFAFPILAV